MIRLAALVITLAATTLRAADRQQHPGFSIIPPTGAHWRRPPVPAGSVIFARKGKSPTHTVSIAVYAVTLQPEWQTSEEFLKFVKQSRAADTDPKRFKILVNELTLDDRFGKFCVKYHTKVEDQAAPSRRGKEPLILEVTGYACIHPAAPDRYFDIQYSERGLPGEVTGTARADGAKFIDDFQFTDVPGPKP